MKRDMITCIRAISSDDFETLLEIIEHKYKKFCEIYWLIREYTDFITYLSYKDRAKLNSLKIEFKVSGIDTSVVINELEKRTFDKEGVDISGSGKAIIIEITREE